MKKTAIRLNLYSRFLMRNNAIFLNRLQFRLQKQGVIGYNFLFKLFEFCFYFCIKPI